MADFKWLCMYEDFNQRKIKPINILKNREAWIKKTKKQCSTKEEFFEKLRKEMMHDYWSKCEAELLISISCGGYIILRPWVGKPDAEFLDVTDNTDFDWKAFAKLHCKEKDEAKIDIYDQLQFQWDDFCDYCWYYHHKYQRKNSKFER